MPYKIEWLKGTRKGRQLLANKLNCDVFIDQHLNGSTNNAAKYSCVRVGSNASKKSQSIGETYLLELEKINNNTFSNIRYINNELRVRKLGNRENGNGNLKYTKMPAVLLEPLFCSNPQQAAYLKTEQGVNQLATALVNTVKYHYPDDEKVMTVGFSVGHRYNPKKPNDRGANVYGGGSEADYAEMILETAKLILEKSKTCYLLPCPLCGSENIELAGEISDDVEISCKDCTVSIISNGWEDKGNIIEKWNNRKSILSGLSTPRLLLEMSRRDISEDCKQLIRVLLNKELLNE